MNKTYDDILIEMKKEYFEVSGQVLDDSSNVFKRLQAVASELFALSTYGDYIFKQAFIQTATGQYLDRHGQIRGCTRKTPSESTGILEFTVAEPVADDIIIPKGTVCSVNGKPFLQYATVGEAVIKAGSLSTSVSATSLGYGEKYNVLPNEITVMVNAPVGISSVTNTNAFISGCDEESDLAYRNRIICAYSSAPNGVGTKSIENVVMGYDCVKDCHVSYSGEHEGIEIVAIAKTGSFSKEQEKMIVESIALRELLGVDIIFSQAMPQNYSIVAEIKVRGGFDKKEVKAEVKDKIKTISSALRIGEELQLNRISKQLMNMDALSEYNIYSKEAYAEVIVCDSNKYLHLNDLVVNCFEE